MDDVKKDGTEINDYLNNSMVTMSTYTAYYLMNKERLDWEREKQRLAEINWYGEQIEKMFATPILKSPIGHLDDNGIEIHTGDIIEIDGFMYLVYWSQHYMTYFPIYKYESPNYDDQNINVSIFSEINSRKVNPDNDYPPPKIEVRCNIIDNPECIDRYKQIMKYQLYTDQNFRSSLLRNFKEAASFFVEYSDENDPKSWYIKPDGFIY